MNFREFIHQKYPIKDKLELIGNGPFNVILERDDLPFDDIRMIDGILQKVVEVTCNAYIPVIELLSYNKEEVDRSMDKDFQEVWYAYMDHINLTDMTIENIISSSQKYEKIRNRKKELINMCENL